MFNLNIITNIKQTKKYFKNFRQKPHLVFDRRLETGGRQNLKMVLPNDYNLEEQLTKFQAKIDQKYPPEVS